MSESLPAIAQEFPALQQEVKGKRLVYLDNAATTQKPLRVIEAMDRFYREDNANVHRGVHTLSQRATDVYEGARVRLQKRLGARHPEEVIFTKGCTEALNLAACCWPRIGLKAGDVILVSHMEHHANLVPWQMAADLAGARVKPIPITDDGEIDLEAFQSLLDHEPVKMTAVKHACNALGTINPVKEMAAMAHRAGSLITVDGAQGLSHFDLDMVDMGADFYAVAAHKAYGPMGVGALYGRRELLEAMPPYQGGGDMIRTVSFEGTTYADLPNKFEAGTPHAAGASAFAEALDWLDEKGIRKLAHDEQVLTAQAMVLLEEVPGLRIVGKARERVGIISFVMEGIHPHDIGTILDQEGVAVRTGHHCCMPLMKRLGLPATARASFAAYNGIQDVKVLIEALHKASALFA